MTLFDVARKISMLNEETVDIEVKRKLNTSIPIIYCSEPLKLKIPEIDGKKWKYFKDKKAIVSSKGDVIKVLELAIKIKEKILVM
ncbi:MAG: hypothetical protein IJ809_03310 [Clostridia bacterium]|nr:hypothetical protein [Clostridia bacterium]